MARYPAVTGINKTPNTRSHTAFTVIHDRVPSRISRKKHRARPIPRRIIGSALSRRMPVCTAVQFDGMSMLTGGIGRYPRIHSSTVNVRGPVPAIPGICPVPQGILARVNRQVARRRFPARDPRGSAMTKRQTRHGALNAWVGVTIITIGVSSSGISPGTASGGMGAMSADGSAVSRERCTAVAPDRRASRARISARSRLFPVPEYE